MGAIAAALGGEALFPALGMAVPDFVKSMQASKLQTCAIAWFLGNTGALRCWLCVAWLERRWREGRVANTGAVQQNLISTGAFEVYYDGRTLFSKLATGMAPQLGEVVRSVVEAHVAAQQQAPRLAA